MSRSLPIILLISVCLAASGIAADPPCMPTWFWDPPRIPCEAGYAPPYEDLSKAYQEAFEDAAWRMFIGSGCRIAGERGLLKTGCDAISMGGTVEFYVDSSGFEAFRKGLVRVDSVATTAMAVVLLSITPISFSGGWVASPVKDAEIEVDPGEFIAQGESEAYFFEMSSWLEAERAARIEAAFAVLTRRRNVQLIIDDRRIETTAEQTDVWMRSLRTVARRIDPETGNRVVMVGYSGFPLYREEFTIVEWLHRKEFILTLYRDADSLSQFLRSRLSDKTLKVLQAVSEGQPLVEKDFLRLIKELNAICRDDDLTPYSEVSAGALAGIRGVAATPEASEEERVVTNRIVIERHYRAYLDSGLKNAAD